jgi:hypothetical protein
MVTPFWPRSVFNAGIRVCMDVFNRPIRWKPRKTSRQRMWFSERSKRHRPEQNRPSRLGRIYRYRTLTLEINFCYFNLHGRRHIVVISQVVGGPCTRIGVAYDITLGHHAHKLLKQAAALSLCFFFFLINRRLEAEIISACGWRTCNANVFKRLGPNSSQLLRTVSLPNWLCSSMRTPWEY